MRLSRSKPVYAAENPKDDMRSAHVQRRIDDAVSESIKIKLQLEQAMATYEAKQRGKRDTRHA